MAAGNREVELVIRAKNEATKQFDSVSKAIEQFTDSQGKASKSAARTGSFIDKLGNDLAKLRSQAEGLTAFSKITTQMDKATASVGRLEGAIRGSADELAKLAREGKSATDLTTRLRATLEQENRSRAENKTALAASKRELSAANAEVARAIRNQERYNAALAKSPKPSSAQRSAGVFVQSDLEAARAQQARLAAEVGTYEKNVTAARAAISALKPEIAAAAKNEARLTDEIERGATAMRRQKEELGTARTTLSEIKTTADRAGASLSTFATAEDRVAAASARAAASLAATRARMEALERAPVARRASAGSEDAGARRAQLEQLRAARQEYQQSEAAVRELAQAMRATEAPTTAMGAALGEAQARARLAKQEYIALQNTLRQSTGSFAQFEQRVRALSTVRPTGQLDQSIRSIGNESRQTEGFLRRLIAALSGVSTAAVSAGRGGTGLRGAFSGIYGEGQQAASVLQRIRGEVLGLATAYVGLHAAISQIGGVITAFQTLEAAQSRLGVVFNQDTGRVSEEIAILRSEAARLGIEFGVLSDEYSKFAVAADAANFSTADTREIFYSVAEAARVNKLSMDQMSGVFLALQQMISKGKVSSEELRRQLGDRLTGAFNIFADAIGVTTAELDEMMRAGEVLADRGTLLAFAAELRERFGPQLEAALESTTTKLGQFRNELLQAQLRVAQGGFIDGLNVALEELNRWFQSQDGRNFFLGLGNVLGDFVTLLAQVPQYMDLIGTAFAVLIAYRLRDTIAGIGAAFVTLGTTVVHVVGTFTALTARAGVMRGAMAAAAVAARGLLRAVGGFSGLVSLGLGFAVSTVVGWAFSVDQATSALNEHRRQLDQVRAAYALAGGAVDGWAAKIKNVTESQLVANMHELRQAYSNVIADFRNTGSALFQMLETGAFRDNPALEQIQRIRDAIDELEANPTDEALQAFLAALNEIALHPVDQAIADFAVELQNAATQADENDETFGDLIRTLGEGDAILAVMQETASEADEALLGLGDAANDSSNSIDAGTTSLEAYTTAMETLIGRIPGLADELKRLKDIAEVNTTGWTAFIDAFNRGDIAGMIGAGAVWGGAYVGARTGDEREASEQIARNTGMTAEGVAALLHSEGLRTEAYQNHPSEPVTIGVGHTGAAGGIQPTPGMTITRAQALAQFEQDVAMFSRQVDDLITVPVTEAMRDALVSIQFNSGGLGQSDGRRLIIDPLNRRDYVGAQQGITQFRTSGSGQDLNGRRRGESQRFASQGLTSSEIEASRANAVAQTTIAIDEQVAALTREAEARSVSAREAEIQTEIEKAENEARQNGVTLTAEQVAQVRAAAGAKYDSANASEALQAQQREDRDLIQELIGLDRQRETLVKELQLAQEQGDSTRLVETAAQIEQINLRVEELLPNAQEAAERLSDPRMVATLQQVALNTDLVAQKLANAGSSVNFLGLGMNQLQQLGNNFASGLVGAFDAFFQGLADGKSKIESLKDAFLGFASSFLRQIGQMIVQTMIFRALNAMFPGMGFGGAMVGVGHTGGLVGSQGIGLNNQTRGIPSLVFANAARYHGGGIVGLKPGEIPAVLEAGEEVLARDDPRHRGNGGLSRDGQQGPSAAPVVKVVNAIDPGSFVSAGLNSAEGEQAVMNFMRANRSTLKGILS